MASGDPSALLIDLPPGRALAAPRTTVTHLGSLGAAYVAEIPRNTRISAKDTDIAAGGGDGLEGFCAYVLSVMAVRGRGLEGPAGVRWCQ